MIECKIQNNQCRSKNDGLLFILETIQGKRIRATKYRHFIKIPMFLYEELENNGVIAPIDISADSDVFFEMNEYFVTISFVHYVHIEDLHVRILNYLVVKTLGGNPIERGGYSKI